MDQEINATYPLKPSWSRLLDRVHTVGYTEQIYTNSLATIVEKGFYPRLISNSKENSSFSLDRQYLWITAKWGKGWAVVNENMKQATLYFLGNDGEAFHQVILTPISHWDCFKCILQTFTEEAQLEPSLPILREKIINNTVNPRVEEVAKKMNREIIRGAKLKCILNTSGGVVKRCHEVGSLMTKFGTMTLRSSKGRLNLNSAAICDLRSVICDIDIEEKSSKFKGTFYDAQGRAQFFIEAA